MALLRLICYELRRVAYTRIKNTLARVYGAVYSNANNEAYMKYLNFHTIKQIISFKCLIFPIKFFIFC